MTIGLSDFERDLLLTHPETKELAQLLLEGQGVLIGTPDQYDQLRDACSDLLQRIGFDENYAPTEAGAILEELIDKLLVR